MCVCLCDVCVVAGGSYLMHGRTAIVVLSTALRALDGAAAGRTKAVTAELRAASATARRSNDDDVEGAMM